MEKQYVACIHKEINKLKELLFFAEVNCKGHKFAWLQQDMAEIQAKSAGIESMLKEVKEETEAETQN